MATEHTVIVGASHAAAQLVTSLRQGGTITYRKRARKALPAGQNANSESLADDNVEAQQAFAN
ncbi:hypothetical protein E2F43_07845 [Seongchinamella unica]|uniref:Uncharacterized protein n=1 Tax=Seongchinamella unica TaxID=2547392 RepID=A0A4R5LRE6_9GAMM|nr:hypothetical protein [Seongchinamella unica]TDG13443.1 hypothetical protein E2F43_07845 [Seongchinamella unica]